MGAIIPPPPAKRFALLPGVLGAVGDSRSSRGVTAASGTTPPTAGSSVAPTIDARSIWQWASVYTQGFLQVNPSLITAASGALTTDLDGQITTMLAAGTPQYCGIIVGTNDASGVTVDAQVALIVAAWTRLLAAGVQPIHVADMARTVAGTTAAAVKRNTGTNAKLQRLAPSYGVYFFDPNRVWINAANADGDPTAALTSDGLHQNDLGGFTVGKALGQDFYTTYCAGYRGLLVPYSAGDRYDATYSPGGNLVANAMLQGSGGTGGSGISGTIPSNVVVTRLSGDGTIAVSTAARADGKPGNWLVLTLTIGTGDTSANVSFTCDTPPQSKVLTVGADIDVVYPNSGAVNDQFYLNARWQPSNNYQPQVGFLSSVFQGSAVGRYVLPPHMAPSNAAAGALRLSFIWTTAAGTRTLKIAAPSMYPAA